MDFVQQRLKLKQEVEQEQKVCLESLSNQPKGQQEMKKNSTSDLSLLWEQERNKKLSIQQLDQQILIKTKKIAELGRQEMLKKQQLGEVIQKVKSQKRILEVLESQAQKTTETWKCNFENLEQSWNCRVAEINAEEKRKLKKVEDKERALRIEIAQKETVVRETTRKEFELELEKVKKSIAEGYLKLKKIYNLIKMVRNNRYLQPMVPMSANQQSPPIHSNQPYLPDSPVYLEQSVPLIIPNQPNQSGLFPRLPLSAFSAQSSQLVGQFYNQQKLQRQRLMVQDELIRTAAATVNANLPSQLPPPLAPTNAEFDSFANSTTSTFPPTINLDSSLPIYSKLIPSTTTSALPNSPSPLFPITSTLTESSMLTSPSFLANLDKSSTTVAKSLSFDNRIEIITIDDSDDHVEVEELTNLNDCGTIEDNETLKSGIDINNNSRLSSESRGNRNDSGCVETLEQFEKRERHLAQKSEYEKRSKANEKPEVRERRLARVREWDKQKRANETPEQRKQRVKKNCECQKRRIANETPEQRERRLAKARQYYNSLYRRGESNSNKSHVDGMSNSSFDVSDSDDDYDEQSSNQQSEMVEFKSTNAGNINFRQ